MLTLNRARLSQFLFDKLVDFWGRISEVLSVFYFLPPLVLRLRITNRCNLSCDYCYVNASLNQASKEALSIAEWGKIIKTIPPYTLIDITGGEPFLTPGFPEIIDMMLDRKLKVALITNATVSIPGLVENLVSKGLSYFMVSIDGDRDTHDRIRGKGSFDKSIKTLKHIIELKQKNNSQGPSIVCKITLTENNYKSLLNTARFLLVDIKVEAITLNLLFKNQARDGMAEISGFDDNKLWTGNEIKFSQELIQDFFDVVEKLHKLYPRQVNIRPDMKLEDVLSYLSSPQRVNPERCHKYRSVITLYHDGKLTPCDLGINVGNIRELNYNFKEIARIKKLKSFFDFFKSHEYRIPGCSGCCLKKHSFNGEE